MTSQQFNDFWASNYPETIPLSHYFKHDYHERWFRIHSLPESKRYADNEEEWNILLTRQNNIISDLLGNSSQLFAVTGEYNYDGKNEIPEFLNKKPFSGIKFTDLDSIDMHKIEPDESDEGTTYRPFIAELTWKQNRYDHILKSIANDERRVFFISVEKKCLIAPYDGGIDFVLESIEIKDAFKTKYKDWLSKREDGL